VQIRVRLFANLADYLPAPLPSRSRGDATLDLPAGSTVHDVIVRLAIPDALPRLTLVNGLDAAPEHPLAAGDVVSIFPPLAGG
jgi:molybdopterin converting factor small subunit